MRMTQFQIAPRLVEYHAQNLASVARPVSAPVVHMVNVSSHAATPVATPAKSSPVQTASAFQPHQFSTSVARPTVTAPTRSAQPVQQVSATEPLAPISGLTLPPVVSQPANTVVPVQASSSTNTQSAQQLFNNYLSMLQSQNAPSQNSPSNQSIVSAPSLQSGEIPNIDNLQNNNLSPALNYSPTPYSSPVGFQQFATSL